MKHRFDLEKLFSFFSLRQQPFSNSQKEKIKHFLLLLNDWSHRQNLISKGDMIHIVERHFFPSLFLYCSLPVKIDGSIIDIGSGAGFPGVLIKIMRPEQPITLLDSSRKKILFLEEVCDQLSLDCDIICERCEVYIHRAMGHYQLAVARAVASLDELWNWSKPLLTDKGALYALKGGNCDQEIAKVGGQNVPVRIHNPDKFWLKQSTYMQQKYIVILEK